MRSHIIWLTLLIAFPSFCNSIDGQWAVEVPFGNGTAELIVELRPEEDQLKGSITSPYVKLPISNGQISAERVAFETFQKGNGGVTIHVRYTGELVGDELHLTGSMEGESGETFVLRRRDPDKPPTDPFVEKPAPDEVLDWLKSQAIRIETVEPENGFADLEPLKSQLATARVVALGEATHGTREFFQMKHRLLEFLVSEMDFTVFAMEANWSETLAVNNYVLSGDGDPVRALAGMYFWTWYTEETLSMIEWMRVWNERLDRKVKFFGFDMQYPAVAANRALEYLAAVDEEAAASLEPRLAELRARASSRDYPHAGTEIHARTKKALVELIQRLDERQAQYASAKPDTAWQLARQHARVAQQAEEILLLPQKERGRERDRYMAENVRWILNNEPAGTKVVLWAHNGHVAASSAFQGEPMGFHLRRMFGDQLVTVGFAFGEGSFQAKDSSGPVREFTLGPPPEGSLDWTLRETGLPLFAVDLRDLPDDGKVREWFDATHYSRQIGAVFSTDTTWQHVPLRAPAQFDVLMFVARTTRARPIKE